MARASRNTDAAVGISGSDIVVPNPGIELYLSRSVSAAGHLAMLSKGTLDVCFSARRWLLLSRR